VEVGLNDEELRAIHTAIGDSLDEGEIAVSWVLTIDIAGTDDTRYLAHRAGGGADGTDAPMSWTALGMLEASVALATDQVRECSIQPGEDDED
jgi:hypothetical protein